MAHRTALVIASFLAGAVTAAGAVAIAAPGAAPGSGRPTTEWLTAKVGDALGRTGVVTWAPSGSFASSAEVRVPRYPFRIEGRDLVDLSLSGVRNEQVSAQLAIAASHDLSEVTAEVSDFTGPGGANLPASIAQLRFVKYVPVVRSKSEHDWSATIDQVSSGREVSGDRNPDVVGDPLVEAASVDVPAYAAQPLWFTFRIPKHAAPGTYQAKIQVKAGGTTRTTYPLKLEIADVTAPDPEDYRFFLDVWLQPETIARSAGVQAWSPAHWKLIEAYQRDLLSRGQKVINTAVVDNPWHHQWSLGTRRSQTYLPYQSLVGWSWDGDRFGFDFSRFDKYVATARAAGVGPRIGAYSMLAFQDREHLTYTDTRTGQVVREDVDLGGARWREAWRAFLTGFEAHLRGKGWLEHTWLSFDERPLETMRVVRDFVHEVAPTFDKRIAIAGSASTAELAGNLSVDWGGIDRMTPELIEQRRGEGKITTFYVYGLPAHPNTLSYSPAIESRMLPWISAQRRMDGFLRWSYNSWSRDVFSEPVFIFTQGDEYLVYPGREGPMSSVRWEQLREGIEDFELIRLLREASGGADSEALANAIGVAVRDLDGRTKDPGDMAAARRVVVAELADRTH